MRTTLLILVGYAAIVTAQPAPRAKLASAATTSFIGVNVQEIDSERSKVLKLREEAGVEVTRVETDSPAEKGGLKVGDVVLQFNGQHVEGMEQFARMVRETPAGREVKLDIVRGGTPQTLMVKVGSRHTPMAFNMIAPGSPMPPVALPQMELRMPDMPRSFMSWRSSVLGLETESLEGQLAQYFGVQEGVLVRSVSKGSAAEKSGIKAGDVIVRIDDSKVASPSDLSTHIRSLRGKPVPMVVMRDRKEVTLTVTIDDSDRSEFLLHDAPPAARPNRQ